MITARTWFVPWASRGESAGTNSEDAESDQSRQNGYAVEDMQHQSKERQQKESQSGQQQRLEGGTGTAGGKRGFWSNGTGSSIEETTAGQKKGAGLSPGEGGGDHISWDPGVQRGTIGRVVLADPGRQEKGESPRGRIQEGANKTAGGRLMKARLNGSMADRIGRTGRTRRH